MKIYINRKPRHGPWGGGNKLVTELSEALLAKKHEVTYSLEHEDIDVILCFDPRPNQRGEWYQTFLQYREKFGAKIIQRVGDLGTHSKPELTNLVRQTISLSDFIIFPSEWAKEWIGYKKDNCVVIHNAALDIFHEYKKPSLELGRPIRLVTHHWSNNKKKGFDIYKKIDELVGKHPDKYQFTYIGRIPSNFSFRFANYIEPIESEKISKILSENNIYVTASREEAGANHVLEGMACGLPVAYHTNGGSIPEYCGDNGVGFEDFDQMLSAIQTIKQDYAFYKSNVLEYNESIETVVNKYVEIACCTKLT